MILNNYDGPCQHRSDKTNTAERSGVVCYLWIDVSDLDCSLLSYFRVQNNQTFEGRLLVCFYWMCTKNYNHTFSPLVGGKCE